MGQLLRFAKRHPLLAVVAAPCLLLAVSRGGAYVRDARGQAAEQTALRSLRCPSGMKAVPGGAFELGDQVNVALDAFCLDAKEVTVAAYGVCVNAATCSVPLASEGRCNWGQAERALHPINCVDWYQAERYCRFVGKTLPSEVQWEYAARGGFRELEYPWGSAWPSYDNACWSPMSNKEATCKVGEFPATSYGLHDMAGNVSEWVLDRYAPYPAHPPRNYVNTAAGGLRIGRGGSFTVGDPMLLHPVIRFERPAGQRIENMGVRCASAPLP